ncbi:manganese efflux pump [Lampropedia puyangensis]|uniref:Putative manganese efflux pump MntP n=1 Tax=Lampropedia puyangensis TaxID=1330072 RepID=A0A4V4GRB9_9BURK|nr:manganese efflux pump MntP family protein [Lampropedia puyangensis]THU01516.1 manganese efflux pump [Lampropedia puyangensis]
MNPLSLLMLGLAMSTDAFAAAIAKGAGLNRPGLTQALKIGAIFGIVEAITPVIGWLLGSLAAEQIDSYDHWIAFALLVGLGIHAIHGALTHNDTATEDVAKERSLWSTALTGLATSIDAMAVGVGLAFVDVNILVAALVIGACTFVMVTIGIMAGKALGNVFGRRAEIAGGIVLIAVGAIILYEHTLGAAV